MGTEIHRWFKDRWFFLSLYVNTDGLYFSPFPFDSTKYKFSRQGRVDIEIEILDFMDMMYGMKLGVESEVLRPVPKQLVNDELWCCLYLIIVYHVQFHCHVHCKAGVIGTPWGILTEIKILTVFREARGNEFTLSAACCESGAKLGAFVHFMLNPHSKPSQVGKGGTESCS